MVQNPKYNKDLMKALDDYLQKNGTFLPSTAIFEYGIDVVFICVDDNIVLKIGLPPVSNYPVKETEHTAKYLQKKKRVAV